MWDNISSFITFQPYRSKIFFCEVICHSVIILRKWLMCRNIMEWQICLYLQYLSLICHWMVCNRKRIRDASIYTSKKYRSSFYSWAIFFWCIYTSIAGTFTFESWFCGLLTLFRMFVRYVVDLSNVLNIW